MNILSKSLIVICIATSFYVGNTDAQSLNLKHITIGLCNESADKIHVIQGHELSSRFIGEIKRVEGVVTSTAKHLKGYFVQEESSDVDNNTASSEAIFVYTNSVKNLPVVGQKVRAIGKVKEHHGRTQLISTAEFLDCGHGDVIAPVVMRLPVKNKSDLEGVEGMLVRFAGELKVVDTHNLGRYGQFTVSNGRLIKPTNIFASGTAQALALADENSRNRIVIDDMNNTQNPKHIPFPTPRLSYDNSLRLGDSVTGLIGVIDYSYDQYRVLPTKQPKFTSTNKRTSAPQLNGVGTLKVASFNVLNYFNGDGKGQGFPTARGADSVEEFYRQSTKIVSALIAINADVVGLMEIENDGFSSDSAIAELVRQLNVQLGENTYQYVSMADASMGSDAITVGLIYKPSTVAVVGSAVTISQAPFDYGNRQPLVQTFKEIASNERFTVAVNHFKSKSSCNRASGRNQDQNDGQGCWNPLRVKAANALVSWLSTYPTGIEDSDILIIGDLNAYAKEDPVNVIIRHHYQNLVAKYVGALAYSYSFDGEIGYLDHALASDSLAKQVVDTTEWHINADEPLVFDYNTERKSVSQLEHYYGSSAYRASDHDPVIILLNLTSP